VRFAAVLISGHQIGQLVGRWGYGLVFTVVALQAAGVPLPGTTALVAAAIYAGTTHHLSIALVILAGALGAIIGASISFAVGRRGGWRMLTRYGHYIGLTAPRLKVGRYLYVQHGGKIVFFGRFITGVRTLGGFIAGSNRMPVPRFMLFNVVGGIVWALANGLGYFYFGHAISTASIEVQVLLAAVGIAWLAAAFFSLRRRGRSLMLAAESAYPGPPE
jgi:membrane protein DedA with SNARE-associated domain